MTCISGPSQATVSWPGFCHNIEITDSPHAGAVTIRPDGTAEVPLSLGAALGRDVVETVTEEDSLVSLVDAALCALSRLKMAHQDAPGRAAA